MDSSLVRWERIKADLAEARTVDELKDIRDRASALKLYMRQAGESQEVQNHVAAIKVRAERRMGELLSETISHGGDRKSKSHDATLKLDDIGITKTQSSRCQQLAAIPEDVFEQHIAEHVASATKELTTKGLLGVARRTRADRIEPETTNCTTGDLYSLVATEQRFGTIYADPPWSYANKATRASAEGEYPVLSVDWMCDPDNMPVASLAAPESHLHLWTTNAFLFESKRLMEAWGFEYKSCFVWVKPTMGIGNYWRVSHEFLLLGVRGGLTFQDRSLISWAELPRGKHSEKPDRVRAMIERSSPGPRLELFARIATPEWTCWGNEIERTLLSGIQLQ